MNKIFFLFFLCIKYCFCFIEQTIIQEYSILCEKNNFECEKNHILYTNIGKLLFDLWLSLDLLFSVFIDFSHYDDIYENLNKKIIIIKENIIKLQEIKNDRHILDIQKLLQCINEISQHQIIKHTENLKNQLKNCIIELKKIN